MVGIKKVLELGINARGAKRGAGQFGSATDEVGRSARKAGIQVDTLDGRTDSVGRQFLRSARSGIRLAAVFGGVLAVGAAVLTANFIKLGSELAETESKFDAVFGKESPRVRAELAELSEVVGRSRNRFIEYASSLQDTFVPMGLARDQAADLTVGLVQLATDLASFNNAATPKVIEDFQSALVGNTETVRKYGIVIIESRVKQEAFRLGLVGLGQKMTEQDKLLSRYSLLVKDTGDAQGDAARTSESFANRMVRLTDAVFDARGEVGKELTSALNDVITEMGGAEAAADLLTTGIKNLGDGLLVLVENSDKIIGFFSNLSSAVNDIDQIGSAIGDLTRAAGGAGAGVEILALQLEGLFDDPFGLDAVGEIAKNFLDPARDSVDEIAESMAGVSGSTALAVGEVSELAAQLAEAEENIQGVGEKFEDVLARFKEARGEKDTGIGKDLEREAIRLQKDLASGLTQSFNQQRAGIEGVFQVRLKLLQTLFAEKAISAEVAVFAAERVQLLKDEELATINATEARERFNEAFEKGADQAANNPVLSGAARTAFNGLSEAVGQSAVEAEDLGDFFDQLGQRSKAVFQQIISDAIALSIRLAIVNALGGALSGGTAQAGGFLGIGGGIIGGARGGRATASGFIGGAVAAGELQRFQAGGLATSGGRDTIPALLSKDEFVVRPEATRGNLANLEALNRTGRLPSSRSVAVNVSVFANNPDEFGQSERQLLGTATNLARRLEMAS